MSYLCSIIRRNTRCKLYVCKYLYAKKKEDHFGSAQTQDLWILKTLRHPPRTRTPAEIHFIGDSFLRAFARWNFSIKQILSNGGHCRFGFRETRRNTWNKFNPRNRQGRTLKLTNRWRMVVPAFAARCRSDWCRSRFWCRAPNCRWSLPSRLHTGTEQS